MVRCIQMFLIEICFHVEVVVSWSEVLLVCLCCVFVQCIAIFPCKIVVSIPFDLELELPVSFSWFNPSRVCVLLHDIVFFLFGFIFITLLGYGDGRRQWYHSAGYPIFSEGREEGDMEYVMDLVRWW